MDFIENKIQRYSRHIILHDVGAKNGGRKSTTKNQPA
jgi:molybdopterin/thiamine biosynthesis adenylyltransferase